MIKKLLTIAAVATAGLLAAPNAEAGHPSQSYNSHTYRSGNASCGCPTYTRRYVRGYDSCRRPIFGYTRLALTHGSSCRHRSVQHRGHVVQRGYTHRNSYSSGPRITVGNRGFSLSIGRSGYSRGYSRSRSCR